MYYVNYFWVNLGTACMGQCILVTDITHLLGELWRLYEKREMCAHNYSCSAVYFERFSIVLWHFPMASSARDLLVLKIYAKDLLNNLTF